MSSLVTFNLSMSLRGGTIWGRKTWSGMRGASLCNHRRQRNIYLIPTAVSIVAAGTISTCQSLDLHRIFRSLHIIRPSVLCKNLQHLVGCKKGSGGINYFNKGLVCVRLSQTEKRPISALKPMEEDNGRMRTYTKEKTMC